MSRKKDLRRFSCYKFSTLTFYLKNHVEILVDAPAFFFDSHNLPHRNRTISSFCDRYRERIEKRKIALSFKWHVRSSFRPYPRLSGRKFRGRRILLPSPPGVDLYLSRLLMLHINHLALACACMLRKSADVAAAFVYATSIFCRRPMCVCLFMTHSCVVDVKPGTNN